MMCTRSGGLSKGASQTLGFLRHEQQKLLKKRLLMGKGISYFLLGFSTGFPMI